MFVESLMNYINDGTDFDISFVSRLENSILLRIIPGAPLTADLQKGQSWDFSFQLLAKDTNQLKAYTDLCEIVGMLQGLSYGDIDDPTHNLITLTCTTTPNWVETNDRKQYIYTALFSAEIIKK